MLGGPGPVTMGGRQGLPCAVPAPSVAVGSPLRQPSFGWNTDARQGSSRLVDIGFPTWLLIRRTWELCKKCRFKAPPQVCGLQGPGVCGAHACLWLCWAWDPPEGS